MSIPDRVLAVGTVVIVLKFGAFGQHQENRRLVSDGSPRGVCASAVPQMDSAYGTVPMAAHLPTTASHPYSEAVSSCGTATVEIQRRRWPASPRPVHGGAKGGRPRVMDAKKVAHARKLYTGGNLTVRRLPPASR
jgi:hypothetical protein